MSDKKLEDRDLTDLSKLALKNLETQERAFKAQVQARLDHYNSVLEMTRAQIQSGISSRQDLNKILEIDGLMSW